MKFVLPIVAAIMVVAAVPVVVILQNGESDSVYAERNAQENIVIRAKNPASDKVSFIRVGEDSNIELLVRLGNDGKVKVALGT